MIRHYFLKLLNNKLDWNHPIIVKYNVDDKNFFCKCNNFFAGPKPKPNFSYYVKREENNEKQGKEKEDVQEKAGGDENKQD